MRYVSARLRIFKETVMKLGALLHLFIIFAMLFNPACNQVIKKRLTGTNVKEILASPRDFEGKEVTITGTASNPVSLLVFKYFDLKDDTGTIQVVTDKILPAKGEKLTVTGKVAVVEIGSQRWIVVQEKSEKEEKKK